MPDTFLRKLQKNVPNRTNIVSIMFFLCSILHLTSYLNSNYILYIYYKIWQLDFTYKTRSDDNCHEWSLVTYHPHDGHPQTQGWSPTTRKYTTDLEIWHLDLTYKTKTSWQLPWMVTYHPKDGHLPEENILHTWNFALGLNNLLAVSDTIWTKLQS